MIKINISENNSSNLLAQTQTPQDCACYVCGGCLFCLLFPPALAGPLGTAIAVSLTTERRSS